MFWQILLAITLGVTSGILTGLIPGIHVNLVSLIALSLSPLLLQFVSPVTIAVFIICLAVTHSFLDSIPSIYLGAPDEAQALSVLPGHRMLLEGRGYDALKLTLVGSFFSLLLCLVLVPLFLPLVELVYPIIKNFIGYILIAVMAYLILKDNKRKYNFLVFALSGCLGFVVLNIPNVDNVLFPLLSGLFGFSVLITSIMQNSRIPKQEISKKTDIERKTIAKAVAGATTVGFIASFLPGFGSSQAAIIATQVLRNIGNNGFLILVGGINTVNFTLSLITLYIIDKARNGAVVAISQIVDKTTLTELSIYFSGALIAGSIAVFLALSIAKIFSKMISKVNYKVLVLSIIGFTIILVFYFSGGLGLAILITATALGFFAGLLGVGKNHCLGCLIVPVICYFVL